MRPRVEDLGIALYHKGAFSRIIGKSAASVLMSDGLDILGMARLGRKLLRMPDREALYRMSLADAVDRFSISPKVERFLRAMGIGLFVNPDPESISAGEIFSYLALSAGKLGRVAYPLGGWKTIWTALERAVYSRDNGEVRFGEEVEKLEIEGGRVRACVTGKERYEAESFVCAFPGRLLLEKGIVPDGAFSDDLADRLKGCRPVYGLNLDMALKRDVIDSSDLVFTVDPPSLAICPTEVEPSLLPRGYTLLTLFTPFGTEMPDKAEVERAREMLLGLYEEMFPGLGKATYEMMPAVVPVISAHVSTDFCYPDRPQVKCPDVENLFFIGDWTRARGAGCEIAFDSAMKCFGCL